MKIAVVGTGYVGLVTGTCFAEAGNEVVCIDIDQEKVRKMQQGIVPIYEPDLETIFQRNIKEGRLSFTTELGTGASDALIIFLALPTPAGEDGSADLSYILKVAGDLAPHLKEYAVVVNKSTVPVGTAEKVRDQIATKTESEFDVVSNPEFLREGFAVDDFSNPDRIIIGTSSVRAKEVMEELYAAYGRKGSPLLFMDERSAEMTKYAANAFLAVKISFMNEIANLCEKVGADVDEVRLGIGSDERIGKRFLFPGIGYGGSCFPKDIQALSYTAAANGYNFKILQAVTDINKEQKKLLPRKIKAYYKDNLEGKKFALWGLAFKPDTDDIREAPALEIIETLNSLGSTIVAYDPEAIENVKSVLGENEKLKFSEDPYQALDGSDALIIATEWLEFRSPDFSRMRSLLKEPVIFDGRNLFELDSVKKQNFYYESIGRRIITK